MDNQGPSLKPLNTIGLWCAVRFSRASPLSPMMPRVLDSRSKFFFLNVRFFFSQLPGLTNHAVLHRLSQDSKASESSSNLPDDNFFDMLMRCQVLKQYISTDHFYNDLFFFEIFWNFKIFWFGVRLWQFILTYSSSNLPDDDFFNMLMRCQVLKQFIVSWYANWLS